MQPKVGGKLHLRLNTDTSPIADKYREGKLKRTLKREFKSTIRRNILFSDQQVVVDQQD